MKRIGLLAGIGGEPSLEYYRFLKGSRATASEALTRPTRCRGQSTSPA